jgi:hypothetical protein
VAIFASLQLSARVRLLTCQFNSPELIELQQKAFKKFMVDDYELIVFNDADSEINEELIRNACEKLHLQCVRYEQDWHRTDPLNEQIKQWVREHPDIGFLLGAFKEDPSQNPSVRHSHVIQYALDHFGYDHDDIVAIVDGDLFPIRPVNLKELLSEGGIIGIEGYRAPFIAFNPTVLPDVRELKFNVSFVNDTLLDTGSHCHHYLVDHPMIQFKGYPEKKSSALSPLSLDQLLALGFRDEEAHLIKAIPPKFIFEFHIDNRFIHLGASATNLMAMKIKLKQVYSWIDFN